MKQKKACSIINQKYNLLFILPATTIAGTIFTVHVLVAVSTITVVPSMSKKQGIMTDHNVEDLLHFSTFLNNMQVQQLQKQDK